VIGPNHAGKTSTIQAIQAAVLGRALPIAGLLKRDTKALLKEGTKAGRALVELPGWSGTVEWPKGTVSSTGTEDVCDQHAAGMVHLLDMKPADTFGFLVELLEAHPSKRDFDAAMQDLKVSQDRAEALWSRIQENGWDAVHGAEKDELSKLRGRWEQIAGENYGSKKVANWRPEGWSEEDESADLDQLDAEVVRLEDSLESAIAKRAVSRDEIGRLEVVSAEGPGIRERITTLEGELEQASSARSAAQETLAGLPLADPGGMPCPHCGEAIQLRTPKPGTTIIEKGERISENEIKARRTAIQSAEAEVARLKKAEEETKEALRAERLKNEEARQAYVDLSAARTALESGDVPDPEAIRQRKASAETQADRVRKARNAASIGDRIILGGLIVEALSLDGIRRTVLVRQVNAVNESYLVPLSDAAGWGRVTISDDLTATYRGRPYVLLSKSEQYRVRSTIQLAVAQIRRRRLVIFDEADILDPKSRGQFLQMVNASGVPTVIGMTVASPGKAPDLAQMGVGRTYWFDHGIATPVDQLAQKAS
jgi:hypothetical protein